MRSLPFLCSPSTLPTSDSVTRTGAPSSFLNGETLCVIVGTLADRDNTDNDGSHGNCNMTMLSV